MPGLKNGRNTTVSSDFIRRHILFPFALFTLHRSTHNFLHTRCYTASFDSRCPLSKGIYPFYSSNTSVWYTLQNRRAPVLQTVWSYKPTKHCIECNIVAAKSIALSQKTYTLCTAIIFSSFSWSITARSMVNNHQGYLTDDVNPLFSIAFLLKCKWTGVLCLLWGYLSGLETPHLSLRWACMPNILRAVAGAF